MIVERSRAISLKEASKAIASFIQAHSLENSSPEALAVTNRERLSLVGEEIIENLSTIRTVIDEEVCGESKVGRQVENECSCGRARCGRWWRQLAEQRAELYGGFL